MREALSVHTPGCSQPGKPTLALRAVRDKPTSCGTLRVHSLRQIRSVWYLKQIATSMLAYRNVVERCTIISFCAKFS